jgi:hypothetical protein
MTVMATAKRKKESAVPNSIRGESAMDKLLATMRDVIEEGARGMTPKELQESERKFTPPWTALLSHGNDGAKLLNHFL